MEFSEWRSNILQILDRIGDEEYQRRAWFDANEEVLSPDEMISYIFDDLKIENFIVAINVFLPDEGKTTAKQFLEALNAFCVSTPENLDPFKVIDDEDWKSIRALATALGNFIRADLFPF